MDKISLWVVIPVKDLVNAKQRLSGVLSSSERRALSQAMVEDMLQCLHDIAGIDGILLVSDDPGAELLAYRYGARVLKEKGHSRGLNAAVQQAAVYLEQMAVSHMLVLHGDLPTIAANDVATLVAGLHGQSGAMLRLVPDRRGQGSNGLLCSLPPPIEFAYGGNSFEQHVQFCQQRGVPCEVLPLRSLQLDIDTPQDLQRLLEVLDQEDLVCDKTRAVLLEYRLASRLRQMQLNETEDSSAGSGASNPDNGIDHAY